MITAREFDARIQPCDLAPFLRPLGNLIFLDSAYRHNRLGRYSYIAAGPSIVLSTRAADTTISFPAPNSTPAEVVRCDPLLLCDAVLSAMHDRDAMEPDALPPFQGGFAGYLGYEYGAQLNQIRRAESAVNSELRSALPAVMLSWYNWVIAFDHVDERSWIVIRQAQPNAASVLSCANDLALQKFSPAYTGALSSQSDRTSAERTSPIAASPVRVDRILRTLETAIAECARGCEPPSSSHSQRGFRRSVISSGEAGNKTQQHPQELPRLESGAGVATPALVEEWSAVAAINSSFTRATYLAAVERVREYIRAGDIFQANISQAFTGQYRGDPWNLHLRLREESPASFAAFLDTGAGTAIASASPEMFLAVSRSGAVESRPVKGTRPLGATPEDEERLAMELIHSAKDLAENMMIVDLIRNDLSRVCEPGSVFVPEFAALEKWATVQHLVSSVCGQLPSGVGAAMLLRAAFPGGSITGAPKERAMEIIAELEGRERGVYCGAIGHFSASGHAQFNIAIRTLMIASGSVTFAAGGGVILDSDPEAEYQETLDKAWGVVRALAEHAGVH